MALFNIGDFTLHSGGWSDFLINCDALTDDDYGVLAAVGLELVGSSTFSSVEGIPRGGLRFAKALQSSAAIRWEPNAPRLVVDDVWTTGASMQEHLRPMDCGLVIFARGSLDDLRHQVSWVQCKAIFHLDGRLRT